MTTEYFSSRRTIRKYKNEAISIAVVEKMLALAAEAPTTGGMQLYSAIITTEESLLKQLASTHFNQPAAAGAPMIVTFCADFNRFNKWCEASDAVSGFGNFQSFMSAVLDTTILAQQFNTIAELNGYGCCYLGTTTYNAPQIAEALELPRFVVPVVALSIGIPDDDSDKAERIPAEGVIHREKYADYSAERISNLYQQKEMLEANIKFVEENGKQSLAQVFTDVRYPKTNNKFFSKVYYDFIESQGFEWCR